MVVEDENRARRALGTLLLHSGYPVETFASAEDALKWLEAGHRARMAIIDLDLPGLSGLELIHRLRQYPPEPVVVLVTATDEETLAIRLEDDEITCLRKPLSFDHLMTTLRRQLPAN